MENVREDELIKERRLKKLQRHRLPHGVKILAPEGDHISKWYQRGVFYEGAMLEHIRRTYPTKMNVIDVGAHIGGHTLFFVKACSARVFAFEPHHELFALLQKNVAINDVCEKCVKLIQAAVGNPDIGFEWAKPIEWPSGNSGMARFEVTRRMDHLPDTVPVYALEDVASVQEWPAIDLIKIDVEGMGLDVLRGARTLLKRDAPAIFIECQTERDRLAAIMELAPYGYRQTNQFNHTPTYEFRAD